ncbi:MAG: VCBS repeat-containing protein, partial [Bacteroidetes bacterium]|nr:VCBS repeat-containing protein [Bacteroidota bacterium]
MNIISVLSIIVFSLTTNIFSQVQFTSHRITTNADNPHSVYAVDVDGDGDIDVLSASFGDNKIAWYENDGNENFTSHTITTNAIFTTSVYAIDVDGDGDIDLLSAESGGTVWYENDGNQNFTSHMIAPMQNGADAIYAMDVDRDGDMDVLSGSPSAGAGITWFENDGNQNFTTHTIPSGGSESVYAIDVDGDGDMDVLSASSEDHKIAWYENDGNENFTPHTIITSANVAYSVYASDVDGDGDMDVLSASWGDDKIAWYENLAPPTISLTSPNGGEEWQAGSTQSITWADNIAENVQIDLYKGGIFHSIISTSTSSDGTRNWNIPFTLESGSDYKVKITSVDNPSTIFDFSDANFTIVGNQITVITPNGGESWLETADQIINWIDNLTGNVEIQLFKGGVFHSSIT